MPGMTEPLSALHKLHLELQRVHDELARGPRQIKVREQKVTATLDQVAQLKGEMKETRAAADRKSLDLKGRETKIADLRGKLNSCTSNREYDILRGQIEADEVASSVLEDEILELLEKVDRLQREIVDTDARAATLRQECSDFSEKFARIAEGLNQQGQALRQQIQAAESPLSGEIAERYQRLVEAYGAEGMASVNQKGICSNCFVALTPQNRVLVGSGEVVFCSNCGRMLYAAAED